jgi:hypothetical protein
MLKQSCVVHLLRPPQPSVRAFMLNMNAGLVSSYWNPAAVWAQTGVVQGLSRWMTLSFPYHWRTCHGHTDTLRWWKKHDDTNPHGRHASFRCRNLVKALFSTLRVALVGQGRQVHVFLDRNRLEDGRMFSSDFARAWTLLEPWSILVIRTFPSQLFVYLSLWVWAIWCNPSFPSYSW